MAGKNSQIHLYLETELFEKLRKQAEENNISISELCRMKCRENSQIQKIESIVREINEKIKCSTKYKQEV